MPEEFENGAFILKTHQMISIHTKPEEFKDTTITGHFGAFSKTLRSRDGLVWTVGLTGEMKLRFQISPGNRGRCLNRY